MPMSIRRPCLNLLVIACMGICDQVHVISDQEIKFQKQILTERYYCDGIVSADLNSDGNADIVAGSLLVRWPRFHCSSRNLRSSTAGSRRKSQQRHVFFPGRLQQRWAPRRAGAWASSQAPG